MSNSTRYTSYLGADPKPDSHNTEAKLNNTSSAVKQFNAIIAKAKENFNKYHR